MSSLCFNISMLPDLNDPYVFFFLAASLFSISAIFFPLPRVSAFFIILFSLSSLLFLLWWKVFDYNSILVFSGSLPRESVVCMNGCRMTPVSRIVDGSCKGPWISSALSLAPSPGVTHRHERSKLRALKRGNPR